jgi:hypothetical protein
MTARLSCPPARVLLVAVVAAGLFAAAPAWADRAETGMEDGSLLAPSGQTAGMVAGWRAMGVDVVRIQAYWDAISPDPGATTPPPGFDPGNPDDPRYNWGALDRAIDLVRANGMRVMLTINQKGPVWASLEPRRRNGAWRPDPRKFGRFASAVARRYGRSVDRYLVGNEPNERIFLAPQTQCRRVGRRRACERVAPSLYRNLVRAAYPAIKGADRNAQVLIGELAPIGSAGPTANNLAPLPFIRAMGCLDDRYRRVTTGVCRGFRAARGDAFGYHPYQNKERPNQPNRNLNLAKLGDLPRLFGVLDRVTRSGRISAPRRRLSLYLTEYGYQTNPPDRRYGVSWAAQSRYLQQSAYIVWATRRVKLITQYLFHDEGPVNLFQTGLVSAAGTAKPSLRTFPHPFFIDTRRGRSRARLWGQVRPGGAHTVTVYRRAGRGTYRRFFSTRTDRFGYWSRVRSLGRGSSYYYTYRAADGSTARSDAVRVG